MKNKTTTILLAFFLGGFGIHRFYLGQTGYGVLSVLFCWTLIPGLIAFIDFFVFIVMSTERFDSKYNAKVMTPQAPPAPVQGPTPAPADPVPESESAPADPVTESEPAPAEPAKESEPAPDDPGTEPEPSPPSEEK